MRNILVLKIWGESSFTVAAVNTDVNGFIELLTQSKNKQELIMGLN